MLASDEDDNPIDALIECVEIKYYVICYFLYFLRAVVCGISTGLAITRGLDGHSSPLAIIHWPVQSKPQTHCRWAQRSGNGDHR